MYHVYVLLNKDKNKTYTGITNNLKRRISQHNKGYGKYSKLHGPWVLVYFETLTRRVEARKREKYLKSSAGRKWIKSNIF